MFKLIHGKWYTMNNCTKQVILKERVVKWFTNEDNNRKQKLK